MTDSTSPGWRPDPSDSTKQRYWDGTQWTDRYAGFFPDPENPGMVRFWDGEKWSGEAMPEAALNFMLQVSKLPGIQPSDQPESAKSWQPVTPAEARGQVHYLDPEQRLKKTRRRVKGLNLLISGFGAAVTLGVIGLAIVFMLQAKTTTFFLFGAGFIIFALISLVQLYRHQVSYSRSRREASDAFLCSVVEAAGIPEGTLCTVTGVIAADQSIDALGRGDCVFFSYWYQKNDNNHQIIHNAPCYLQGENAHLYIEKDQLRDKAIGAPQLTAISLLPDAWAAFAGDEISVTGHIKTRPDGSRGFEGEVEIGFPVAAYQDGRISSSDQADSARQVSKGPMGPAVVVVTNGKLFPGSD